jgi:hypothetical protein
MMDGIETLGRFEALPDKGERPSHCGQNVVRNPSCSIRG